MLVDLIEEFGLSSAELSGPDWKIAFRKKPLVAASAPVDEVHFASQPAEPEAPAAAEPANFGLPVSSPMTGIYYSSPSPNAEPFVKEGDTVQAGQVIALIEAMKVFNEINAPTSGRVTKVAATSGQLVQPGEPLLFIG